ncbi:MAG: glutathione peroxidase [Ginsengibacter sp.]
MKKIVFAALPFILFSFAVPSSTTTMKTPSIYQFKVPGLLGGTIDFSKFKGKKILIVNTASKCGNTPQYDDLENLYKEYKNQLVIIGFPANNFGSQEPGTNDEIAEFCKKNYGVTFPMAAKVSVKGNDIAPIYKFIVADAEKHGLSDPIKWNFTKFLYDENGNLLTVFFNADRLIPNNPEAKGKAAYEKLLGYLNH